MNKIDWNSIAKLLIGYERYPIALRIAKQIYLQGVREEDFTMIGSKLMDSGVPEPVVIQIQNYWRDIDRGSIRWTIDDIPDVVV